MDDEKVIPPDAMGERRREPAEIRESIGGRLYATPLRLVSLWVFIAAALALLVLQWVDLGGLSDDWRGYLVIGCLVVMGGAALVNRVARITGN